MPSCSTIPLALKLQQINHQQAIFRNTVDTKLKKTFYDGNAQDVMTEKDFTQLLTETQSLNTASNLRRADLLVQAKEKQSATYITARNLLVVKVALVTVTAGVPALLSAVFYQKQTDAVKKTLQALSIPVNVALGISIVNLLGTWGLTNHIEKQIK